MKHTANNVRIIGGRWKRRMISFESIEGLRPTPDRIRETLFNWLMWEVQGKIVLDVCAGSGVLGFEALSRGAAHCIFVEPHVAQCKRLRDTVQQLDCAGQVTIIEQKAQQARASITQPIDILFLDPPYALNMWTELANLYDAVLQPDALIYVEANCQQQTLALPMSWQLYKQVQAGEVQAGLWQRQLLKEGCV